MSAHALIPRKSIRSRRGKSHHHGPSFVGVEVVEQSPPRVLRPSLRVARTGAPLATPRFHSERPTAVRAAAPAPVVDWRQFRASDYNRPLRRTCRRTPATRQPATRVPLAALGDKPRPVGTASTTRAVGYHRENPQQREQRRRRREGSKGSTLSIRGSTSSSASHDGRECMTPVRLLIQTTRPALARARRLTTSPHREQRQPRAERLPPG